MKDNIIIAACLICVVLGSVNNRRKSQAANTTTTVEQETQNNHDRPGAYPPNHTSSNSPTFEHRTETTAIDLSINRHDQRLNAIREHAASLTPDHGIAENFDRIGARENMKRLMFSANFNGGSNTLSDAEKWEHIESGKCPW